MWLSLVAVVTISLGFCPNLFSQKPKVPGSYSNARGFGNEKSQTLNTTAILRMSKLSFDYVLGTGDELKIEIIGQVMLNSALQSLKISNSGEISIPLLGSVQAANLTAAQLESKIASLLREKQLVKQPEVLVYVTDYQAKPIFVVGEVDNPGEYMMTQHLTFTEAILMAGGIDFGADRFGFLHRRGSASGQDWKPESLVANPEVARQGGEVIKIDLQPLKEGGVLKPDILLRKGDVIVVPKRKVELFYVVGDVRGPGAYEITTETLSVSQAISKAGGPNQTAKTSQGLLIRYNRGTREQRKVDFAAILRGKQPDFEVLPSDIVFIPGSNAKSLGYGLLGVIPQTVERTTTQNIQ